MSDGNYSRYTAWITRVCLFGILWFFVPVFASAASLSLSPATGVFTNGTTFTVAINVNTSGAAINAAEGTVSFNPNELSVVSVQKGTIFNLWTAEPAFSNSAGTITFSGGSPTGYTGSNGTIIRVTFRSKASGVSKVTYKSGSVLAADGRGTNVLSTMNGGSYTITAVSDQPAPEVVEYVAPANTPAAPVVTSPTHPDPAAWYQAKNATLRWSVPAGVTAVRTLLDTNAGSIPTKVYNPPITEIELPDLAEGIQYFHIQMQNADGWGRVTHYRLAVDSERPKEFTMALPEDADLSRPEQRILLKTVDDTSAVKRFLVQLDGAEPYEYIDSEATGELLLQNLTPGYHSLIVEAFDEAGNSIINTFSFGILAFDRPQFTDVPAELTEGVIPVIRGITRPGASVAIKVESSRAQRFETTVTADENGVFTFIPEQTFSVGVYTLTAQATDSYGAQSDVSEPVKIAVQQPGFVRIGSLVVSVLSIIVPLIGMLLLVVVMTVLTHRRLRIMRRGVTKETDEALQILKSEFERLKHVVDEAAAEMATARKTKKLTVAEQAIITRFTEELERSNAKIRKEVDDVDDQV